MAATTPEQFLREVPDFLADAEPLSPSLFLDLPPTPARSPSPPRAGSPDDLDLDFISRMLMEEDIDDKFFYQYPDHPAILSAQYPFAQIISDSNNSPNTTAESSAFFSSDDSAPDKSASSSSDDSATNAGHNSTSDDSATNAGNSTSSDSATNAGSNSTSSSLDAVAPASPIWPYDPIELSQLLRSPPYIGLNSEFPADDAGDLFFPSDGAPAAALSEDKRDDSVGTAGQNTGIQSSTAISNGGMEKKQDPLLNNGTVKESKGIQSPTAVSNGGVDKKLKPLLNNGTVKESKQKPVTSPAEDGGQDVLASAFFNGGTDSDMAMLNMAFRKGMEEANKFLPTNNALLIDLDAISDKPGSQVKKDEADGFGTLMFGNGRGRKKRHEREDLEAETGRNSKLMTWEQEEIGAREMVDEIMLHGIEICMKGMEDLRIAMGSEAEKNTRKGTGNGKAAQGKRGTSNEVVDLRTMLIHCAQAVASGDRRGSNELLSQIKKHSSPQGDATQRLAYCFAQGLEARLAGTGSQVYQSLVAKRTSVMEYLKAFKLYMAASSFEKLNMAFVGMTIINAMKGKKRLHIVNYNVNYGFQWPGLLKWLAIREDGPPEVRITGIDLPQPGFRPAFQLEETGRRLSNCAREFGLPFKFHGIAAKLETVCVEDLNIDPDEVLVVVASQCCLSSLMDESLAMDKQDSPSPRDMVLSNIQKMRPDVFIESVVNGTYGAPFFVTRFREALFFYSAQFDMLDATIPRDNDERHLIERDILGRRALNVIACEGADRVDRPETYKQWQVRSERAGLRQLPLNPEVVKVVRDKVSHYHKDFLVDVDHQWVLSGWKGRVLYAMSTWVAAEDDSSKF